MRFGPSSSWWAGFEPRRGRGRTRVELEGTSAQPAFQLLRDDIRCGLLAQGAFPDGCDSPAGLEQIALVAPVPFRVRIELGLPELLARSRCGRVRAVGVPVPEAAVHQADGAESAEHEVGSSREFPIVQTVSKSPGVDGSTKSDFGSRVPASDPRHHARPSRAVHDVCHRRSCTAHGAPQTTGYTRCPGCCAAPRDAAKRPPALVCTPPLRRRSR